MNTEDKTEEPFDNADLPATDKPDGFLITIKELAFQNEEKDKRAAELVIANKELAFQNEEKEKRVAELIIANKELVFQNKEKEKRAAELNSAVEKEKNTAKLLVADKALVISEIRYRRLFETAHDGIMILAADTGVIVDVNPFLLNNLGYSHAELMDKQLWEIGLFKHVEENKAAFKELQKNGYIRYDDLPLKAKNGDSFWVEFVSNVYEEDGKQVIQCNVRDITERKKTQMEIKALNESLEQKVIERTAQLEDVNKELESFSYSVSHDLRAPLRSIHGFSQILKEEFSKHLNSEANRLINKIMSNAKKMSQLIDDLLSYSRIGRQELQKNLVNMQYTVEDVCRELKSEQEERQIEFRIAPLLPVHADRTAIRQVWVNLIANAIKYSKLRDNAIIEIGCEENEAEIIYHIKDNGAGFDMRHVNKLFGVFQRLHSDKEFEGSGVGLAIVQRIITKHGGKVWGEGKVNEGAIFYFTLTKS